MNLEEIQSYIADRISAHPSIVASGAVVIQDDGTYPKNPERAVALSDGGKGVAITIWQVDGESVIDASLNGPTKGEVYVPVVVEENVSISRASGGANLPIEKAVRYVMEAVVGRPANALGNQRASLMEQPFKNFGKIAGVNRIVVNVSFPFFIQPIV